MVAPKPKSFYEDQLDWFERNYGVRPSKGRRVRYTGNQDKVPVDGTVTGLRGPSVLIRLDGAKHSDPFHPTWELTFL